jgi:long-chain acyl-CoA synthetase
MSDAITTTAELIAVRAAETGDRPAVTFDGHTVTYAELDARAERAAAALAAAGVGRGERVVCLAHNGPAHFELLFGCAKLGAVLVPVNWRLAPAELTGVIADSSARLVVCGDDVLAGFEKARPDLPGVERVVVLGDEYEAWLAGAPDRPAAVGGGIGTGPDDVALQMYTSGTTGRPKGVMLANRNLWSVVPVTEEWGLSAESVVLVCMPLFHLSGMGWSLPTFYQGGHVVLLADPDPAAILDAIPRHGVTETLFVPALIQFLLTHPVLPGADLSSLRTVYYGGSPISEETLRAALDRFGCGFVQLYGLTECAGLATYLPAADHDPGGPRAHLLRSIGRPAGPIEVRVVAPDTGADQPPGAVGEIRVRSGGVMAGYWNQPDATAEVIGADGWLRTGDAAYRDDDGYLFIYDRVKDMIVSGGENVFPAEVENALHSHPAVGDVAVIGVPDERWGETIKAVVVAAPGAEVVEADLIAFARERLAHYKCPTSVDVVAALPRNATGKILKRELREQYWEGHQRRVH